MQTFSRSFEEYYQHEQYCWLVEIKDPGEYDPRIRKWVSSCGVLGNHRSRWSITSSTSRKRTPFKRLRSLDRSRNQVIIINDGKGSSTGRVSSFACPLASSKEEERRWFLFPLFVRPTRNRAIYVDRSSKRGWIRSRHICIASRNSPREFRFFAPRNNGDINLRDRARSSLKGRARRKREKERKERKLRKVV